MINRVQVVKYLGFTLNDKLNWNAHINTVCQCLEKIAISFEIIKNYVPKICKQKQQLHYAQMPMCIEKYYIEAYEHNSSTQINKFEVFQNKMPKLFFKDTH